MATAAQRKKVLDAFTGRNAIEDVGQLLKQNVRRLLSSCLSVWGWCLLSSVVVFCMPGVRLVLM